ncbi:hypothetical protein [Lacipirellula parvula]|uniref:Uncharacterized protein n=1 Tax=Lacipirellula parvula TaxID=2650471 RepID=A0A5K7XLX7_9BACT|nr:hypothetical protein [Lacipirellula parvula]BBO35706.1 hypothetical protein PLANPX_5318 [Lacipirellula parvula]
MTRIPLRLLVVAVVCFVAMLGNALAEVSVRGYTRKDGTYVRPHYRSDPDGNFWNNWSTIGNINPHTGERGTKRSPPAGYGGGSYTSRTQYSEDGKMSYAPSVEPVAPVKSPEQWAVEREAAKLKKKKRDESSRQDVSAQLLARGVEMDWQQHTSFELYNAKYRVGMADTLREEGVPVEWKNLSAIELNEMKNRVQLSKKIKQYGIDVDWEEYTAEELHDMIGRIKLAKYIREVSPSKKRVDWRKFNANELSRMSLEK